MPNLPLESATMSTLMLLLKRELAEENLHCPCRDHLEGALERIAARDICRRAADNIERARISRGDILRLLAFLGDIDDLGTQEEDLSVFHEAADLFDDIARAASAASRAMRQAAAGLALDAGKAGP